ncbi:Chanoclavine-I aldehyde reductase fgaOx3 [Colletotrichum tropicale]|nr:Chanoclavine-I aldehyde reductase fgaOx3 [Colletotrichum tropicale]
MTDQTLFQAAKVGCITTNHRIVMAPLTRFRADNNHVPSELAPEYYGQRASVSGTLLVTEATFISEEAGGYLNVPGIWNQEQIDAWEKVTKAVHKKGSFIFLQLWALGRVAVPEVARAKGFEIISSSDKPFEANASAPKPATKTDIQNFVEQYAQAARNAIKAGFDGVEIHGAGGYLIDQFTQDNSNNRTDEYGGSVENRSRFVLEVARAVTEAIGPERVGIRLSPWQRYQGMRMVNPIPQFTHVIKELGALDLAYLHLIESRVNGNVDCDSSEPLDFAINAWDAHKPVILAGGYTPESARQVTEHWASQKRDILVAFGRSYISTPDLPFRIREGIPLTPYDRRAFYDVGSAKGYADYEFSPEFQKTTEV